MQARRASEGIRVAWRDAVRIPLLALRAWMGSGISYKPDAPARESASPGESCRQRDRGGLDAENVVPK